MIAPPSRRPRHRSQRRRLPLATPALLAGRTALTADFFSFQIEVNLFAIVFSDSASAIQHKQSSAFTPCRSRFRICNADNSQQLDEFFIRILKITGQKGILLVILHVRAAVTDDRKTSLVRPVEKHPRPGQRPPHPTLPPRFRTLRCSQPRQCPHLPLGRFFCARISPVQSPIPSRSTNPVSTIQENDMVHRRFGSRR